MKKSARFTCLLTMALAFTLFQVAFDSTAHALPRVKGIEELNVLQEDISLLNLLRGLYLSESQVSQLCEISLEADNAVKAIVDPILQDKAVILGAFTDLRNSLFEAPGKETQAQQKAHQINERIKEAQGKVLELLGKLEVRASHVLTAAQLEIVEGFIPCLIPPSDLKNPVRVGQAGAAEGPLARMAELIYATPEDVWSERKMVLLGKVARKMEEQTGKLSDSMRTDLVNRLSETAKKIRATDPVDFPLKKGDLADEMLLIDHTKRGVHGHKTVGKVGKWFLSEAAAKLLPRWKDSMEAGMDQVSDADSASDDFKVEPDTSEMAKRLKNTLSRFYQKRSKNKSLPPFEEIKNRIDQAEKSKDPIILAQEVLRTIDSLASAEIFPQLNKALVQLIRGSCKHLKLPLISEKHDPYGFFEELNAAKDSVEPKEAFQRLRKLADMIVRFKKL